jgi:2-polyprenyl-3-methyl-5-hydroxy-6-metoxy-1,4-benzoquinol methylase
MKLSEPKFRTTQVQIEELAECPWCGSQRFETKWQSYDRLHLVSRQTFGYQHCRDCDLIFQSPRPVESDIHHFYPQSYGPYHAKSNGAVAAKLTGMRRLTRAASRALNRLALLPDRMFRRAFEKRYYRFYRPARPGLALLDFGCGSDKFLNQARDMGWTTTGMDFSPQAVEQARASGHRALMCGDEAWRELADGSFHFVRLSHVLEHLYHPREVLRQLARKMAPGAMLHLGLPNPQCLSSRVFGSRWFSLDCPRHIMLFTVAFLQRELPSEGFSQVRVLHEPVTKDFARSWAYRQFDRGRIDHAQIEGYQSHPLNGALAVPIRALAGTGCGERIHVFARKA